MKELFIEDLKPENILVKDNIYYLADFGIASYNPEIFKLHGITEKKERIGNRLFSAPEQEDSSIEAKRTMDIYSFGQILQWYITGKTHRGTGRKKISAIYPSLRKYDSIIEKCLSHNPLQRFQDIREIRAFIERNKEKDPFSYLHKFDRILRKHFPKNEFGIVHSGKINRIDKLFNELKENELFFEGNLWWHDGMANNDVRLTHKTEGVWKFQDTEHTINEIWVHYNSSVYNNYILVRYKPSKPFIISGEEFYHTAIVDDKYHITSNEYENGFAEIEEEVVDLSNHKVEFIYREKEEGYFFIGINFSCVILDSNDDNVRRFIQFIKNKDGKINIEAIKKFNWTISRNKHEKVRRML